jgi:uridylate kinase
MFTRREPPIVLSIGGSLIVPGGIDHDFLKKLNVFIRDYVKQGKRFFLVAGGGKTARHYRDAGKEVIGDLTDDDLDWLGIHSTRLNAHLLRTIFQDIAHPRIIDNYDRKLRSWKEPVVIGSGWKPGWSTDYDAVLLARDYGANLIVNLSNIDWVYDKDPRKYPDAKPIEKMTWHDMERLVGTEWSPGINAPFDPIAAQLAKKLDLTVIVANGENFRNMKDIFDGNDFKGTVIMPYRIDASFYDREYYHGKKSGHKFMRRTSFIGKLANSLVNWYRALIIKLYLDPKNALDVGCGTGELVKALRAFGIDAHGVEISKDALEMVDPEVKDYITAGDVTNLPYKTNEFELVLTFDVLEHIDQEKIKKAMSELVRVSHKYVLNKIYTKENTYMTMFHSKDFSRVSLFTKEFWRERFSKVEGATVQRNSFFKLPSFFETVFLLRKKSK